MRVLAGDIGGTNTRLALMRATDGELAIERRQTLASQSLDGLSAAAAAFAEGAAIEGAAFAVAGPVHEGSAKLTNLRWSVNATELRSALGVPSEVLNDFASVALGVPHVADQLDPIRPREGSSKSQGVRLFVGAGTGFGVAYAFGDAVHASEGGHIGLSPYDDASERAWRYAHERFGRVSVERLVSGPGLALIDAALGSNSRRPATDGAEVTRLAAGGDEVALQALTTFAELYGAAAGDLALALRPDVLYIAGGIAQKLRPDFDFDAGFLRGLENKGRMKPLVQSFPVYVVTGDEVGLMGAGAAAVRAASSGRT